MISISTAHTLPPILDNTMRAAYAQCPGKFALRHVLGLTPSATSPHLNAGGALAKGLEVTRRAYFGQTTSVDEAMTRGVEAIFEVWQSGALEAKNKTLDRVVEAFYSYWDEYGLDTDVFKPYQTLNGPAVEFSFCVPLEGIQYAGRFDMLAVRNDQIFIVDEKTSGQLGGNWAQQWDIDGQITGYIWALRELGYSVAGAVIRGIGFYANEIKHVQHFTTRTEAHITAWKHSAQYTFSLMQGSQQYGHWSLALDKSICSSYSGCDYRGHCTKSDPVKSLSDAGFVTSHWSPLPPAVNPHTPINP